MAKKTCRVCGMIGEEELFEKKKNRCKQCRNEYNEKWRKENPEYNKKYYAENSESEKENKRKCYKEDPEKFKERSRKWVTNNPEKNRERSKQWSKNNPERKEKQRKKWVTNNPEKLVKCIKKFREENPEKIKEYIRKYDNTPKGKNTIHKKNAKRRNLGHDPINTWFKEAEAHHLRYSNTTKEQNNDITLYVPRKLHRSISHNGNTGRGMRDINMACLDWYISNTPLEERDPKATKLYLNYCMLPEPKWNTAACQYQEVL
jgi:hypothetical protein